VTDRQLVGTAILVTVATGFFVGWYAAYLIMLTGEGHLRIAHQYVLTGFEVAAAPLVAYLGLRWCWRFYLRQRARLESTRHVKP
jgi:predicted MFS family arabinose efflux permease